MLLICICGLSQGYIVIPVYIANVEDFAARPKSLWVATFHVHHEPNIVKICSCFWRLCANPGFWLFQFNLCMFAFLLTLFGLQQPIIFKPENKQETNKSKYSRSGLMEDQLQKLAMQIKNYLDENKPYLNPEYSLQLMSKDLGLPRQTLSARNHRWSDSSALRRE